MGRDYSSTPTTLPSHLEVHHQMTAWALTLNGWLYTSPGI